MGQTAYNISGNSGLESSYNEGKIQTKNSNSRISYIFILSWALEKETEKTLVWLLESQTKQDFI